MIDVKKMLYRYFTYIEGEKNAIKSRERSWQSKQYPSGVASYSGEIMARGGMPSSTTERFALLNIEQDSWEHYDLIAKAYREVIEVIEGAIGTLDEIQQKLIREKYFNGRTVDMTANILGVGIRAYWTHHKNAMEGLEICLNGGDIRFSKPSLIPKRAVKNAVNRIPQKQKTAV